MEKKQQINHVWKGIGTGLCPIRPRKDAPRQPIWVSDLATAKMYAKPILCEYDTQDLKLEDFNLDDLKKLCSHCDFSDWVRLAYGKDPITSSPLSVADHVALAKKLGFDLREKKDVPTLGRVSFSEVDQKLFARLCSLSTTDGWTIPSWPSSAHGGSGFHPEDVICDTSKLRLMGAIQLPDKPFKIRFVDRDDVKLDKVKYIEVRGSETAEDFRKKVFAPRDIIFSSLGRVWGSTQTLSTFDLRAGDTVFWEYDAAIAEWVRAIRDPEKEDKNLPPGLGLVTFRFMNNIFLGAPVLTSTTGGNLLEMALRKLQNQNNVKRMAAITGENPFRRPLVLMSEGKRVARSQSIATAFPGKGIRSDDPILLDLVPIEVKPIFGKKRKLET